MHLVATGISHHTAALDIRERLAFTHEDYPVELGALRQVPGLHEAVLVSTCNRTEIYAVVAAGHESGPADWLLRRSGLPVDAVMPHLYRHFDRAAVAHLFRVASGIDSLVLGEPQIAGQLKDAWQGALTAGTAGKLTDRLFQHAFAASKQVRHATGIGEHPVSVAYITALLARRVFGQLAERTILLVGAGEMVRLCGRHFRQQGVGRMLVANRNLKRAQDLAAEFGAEALPLTSLDLHLAEADVLVSSTASREPVIAAAQLREALRRRRHRPMFLVDLAVPRDIEPAAAELDDVYLYTIDDLQQVASENQGERERAAQDAGALIDAAVEDYQRWLHGARAAQSLQRLRDRADVDGAALAARALRQLEAGGDPARILPQLANTLAHRILHGPSRRLREAAEEEQYDILEAADWLFTPGEDGEPER